jgi:L-arabinose isomerase
MDVAVAYNESFEVRCVRFGDNMRNVAVTDGDKVEAEIQFGWTVDYYPIHDLVVYVNAVSDADVDKMFAEYQDLYDFDYGTYEKSDFDRRVKVQIRQEIGLKTFMDEKGYNAFTSNFEDLEGLEQLPGLAVQRLMQQGYGFAGEGDWKTACLDRVMKVMAHFESTGFMEDYTYELSAGNEAILQSHMLEVDPAMAVNKPKVVCSPLSMGDREDPARLVFDGKAGDGVVCSMADFGTGFKLVINEVDAFTPTEKAPMLPVARVMWIPRPGFHEGITSWIQNGFGHHTVVSLALTSDQMLAWAKMMGVETVTIK